MWAEDGALIRLRFAGSQASGDALAALAPLAARYSTGGAMLTRRAKVELRGVARPEAALAALREAGLVETGVAADLPDIVVCDAPGQDRPARRLDRALRAQLARVPGIERLPDKFLVAIVGDQTAAARALRCDIRLARSEQGWQLTAGDTHLEGLSSDVALSQAVRQIQCCLAQGTPQRIATAGSRPSHGPQHDTPTDSTRETLGFVFGVVSAPALAALGDIAGTSPIGLLPNRRVFVPGLKAAERTQLIRLGALRGPDDPRAGLTACIGRRGCGQASTDTRADALALAEHDPDLARAGLHVSGCIKGCAARSPRPLTLVGRQGGYDLVEQGGPAGQPVLSGASMREVRAWLSARTRRAGTH